MNKLFTMVALSAALLPGCVVHSYDNEPDVVYVPENRRPEVIDAAAGVFWDSRDRDDIWYFDAVVDDPDHVSDVVSVWADVYDERTNVRIETFELYPTNDPYVWYAEFYGSTTRLDPFYRNYTVDIVAYDSYDDWDALTVWADTY